VGTDVVGAGDVNADGFADTAVANSPASAVYLYLGSSVPDGVPDLDIVGCEDSRPGKGSVAGAGDINGDGLADLLVGEGSGGTCTARALVFLGSPALDGWPDLAIARAWAASTAGAGDLNADGFSDMLVGGPSVRTVEVHLGRWTPDDTTDLLITGISDGCLGRADWGSAMASAGDVNGDGIADVVLGDPCRQRAELYLGLPTLDATPDLVVASATAPLTFGYAVAAPAPW
jgi:hypothetical protein